MRSHRHLNLIKCSTAFYWKMEHQAVLLMSLRCFRPFRTNWFEAFPNEALQSFTGVIKAAKKRDTASLTSNATFLCEAWLDCFQTSFHFLPSDHISDAQHDSIRIAHCKVVKQRAYVCLQAACGVVCR